MPGRLLTQFPSKKNFLFFSKIILDNQFLIVYTRNIINKYHFLHTMALANTPYRDLPTDMVYFDYSNLQEIEDLSAGLDAEEVCAWYGLTLAEIQTSESDWRYFNIAFGKGRANAKRKAVNNLFEAMRGRQAKESAISYLARFSDNWKEPVASDSGSTGKFSFKVEMD